MAQIHYPPNTPLRGEASGSGFIAITGTHEMIRRSIDVVALDAWRMDDEDRWTMYPGTGWTEAANIRPTDPDEADRILADYTAWRLIHG